MISGCFGKFEEVPKLSEKLTGFAYTREEMKSGEQLTSAIQVSKVSIFEDDDMYEGLIVDEEITRIPSLTKDESGRYVINYEHKPVAYWAEFTILGSGLVCLNNSEMRSSAYRILSQALASKSFFVKPLGFNVQELYKDFKGHWMDGIVDRKGHWHSGTLYGEQLETDDAVGKELLLGKKTRVGFYTQYFADDEAKVAVTKDGTVSVWSNPPRDKFLKFVMDELSGYMVT